MKIGYLLQEGVPDIRKKPLSGAANHVCHVIRELQKAGHSVHVLAKLDQRIWRSDDLEDFRPVVVRRMDHGPVRCLERAVRRIQYELHLPYANCFESLRFALACRQEIADCDVFFERMGWLGYGGGLAARWLNVPLVLEVNGDHLDEFTSQGLVIQKGQRILSNYLMRKAATRVSHVASTGEGWRQKYIERWEGDPSKVSVVENGSALVDLLQRSELRAFRPLDPEAPMRIAYCGGFEAWHGLSILVHAVRIALEHDCKLQMTLLGSGTEESRVTELVQELGLQDAVLLTGQVNLAELARYLAQADVGVSPYCGRVEYSGLKLLDYKAAGLATIASGVLNQPAVISHQQTGWIVPPCDEEALAQAIMALAEDPQLRRRIGQQARLEAETTHTWRRTTEQLLEIFCGVLSHRT